LFNRGHGPTDAIWQQEEPVDEVKPVARVPTVEHREPCELRGSRTVLGAPGGEIPPGDSTCVTSIASPNGGAQLYER
jgi:hypothetical protein